APPRITPTCGDLSRASQLTSPRCTRHRIQAQARWALVRDSLRGMSKAANQPTTAKQPTITSAEKYWPPPGMAPATSEPAIATPSDEPRLETLRDTPEISPCTLSGHTDCTRLTDAVSMIPTPMPMRNRPGMKLQTLGFVPPSA